MPGFDYIKFKITILQNLLQILNDNILMNATQRYITDPLPNGYRFI